MTTETSETTEAKFLRPEEDLDLLEGGVAWGHVGPTCWIFRTIIELLDPTKLNEWIHCLYYLNQFELGFLGTCK